MADKTRTDRIVERLRNLQMSTPDIEASALVSVDGLAIASLHLGLTRHRVEFAHS
jgi:predicted regulator of Ras-like GTPase activity (Roadblock/LC7/MglB family)